MPDLNVILVAADDGLFGSWERFCGELEGITVRRGSILDTEADALVSPANSFGFMDGGLDGLYTMHFGTGVQQRLQEAIVCRHYGELLVGEAEIVETGHRRHPFVISAPTMRVPMRLPSDTVNPFLAARAVLLLIRFGTFAQGSHAGEPVRDHVHSVAFPGLGTGVGGVGPGTCAHQVRAALDEVLLSNWSFPDSWADASERHQLLYTDKVRDLQRP